MKIIENAVPSWKNMLIMRNCTKTFFCYHFDDVTKMKMLIAPCLFTTEIPKFTQTLTVEICFKFKKNCSRIMMTSAVIWKISFSWIKWWRHQIFKIFFLHLKAIIKLNAWVNFKGVVETTQEIINILIFVTSSKWRKIHVFMLFLMLCIFFQLGTALTMITI